MALKYFTNINDIPKDKHPAEGVVDPGNSDFKALARNIGNVVVRCFINAYSPFLKREKVEHVLSFNDITLRDILKYSSDDVKKSLGATPGMEGLHFVPKYVYRSNYIFELRPGKDITEAFFKDKISRKRILEDDNLFNFFYKEIVENKNSIEDNTRYKREQSWVSVHSVFDAVSVKNISTLADSQDSSEEAKEEIKEICNKIPTWVYSQEKVSSGAGGSDTLLDYKRSFVYNGTVKNERNINKINRSITQMPKQKAAQTCAADGVHWRLLKRTPLYRGEDFFIEFRKKAKSTNVVKRDITRIPFGVTTYAPLDITSNKKVPFGSKGELTPVNLAVAPPSSVEDEDNKENTTERQAETFDFSTQAYYIIELGHMTVGQNYFIVICERSFPVFIGISSGTPAGGTLLNGISRILSTFQSIPGRDLINADDFRMTVRNHLGRLVIQFEGTGLSVPPWVVEKTDIDVEEVEVTVEDEPEVGEGGVLSGSETTTSKKVVSQWTEVQQRLEVPRGHMTLWGGNILCAFSFGPLQYNTHRLNFIYPPIPVKTKEEIDLSSENNFGFNNTIIDDAALGQMKFTIPQTVSLPWGEEHELSLTSTDLDVQDRRRDLSFTTAQRSIGNRMFTQDAQFFLEYPNSPARAPQNFFYGSFMGGLALRELAGGLGGRGANGKEFGAFGGVGGSSQVQHSYIFTTKFRKAPDQSRRMEVFVVGLAMGAGDHLFSSSGIFGDFVDESKNSADVIFQFRTGEVDYSSIPDNQWLLLACKTPIFTTLRLKSLENQTPRWISTSIDASDHVMDYSESWSAADFFTMEHTGTIKFLLNRDMIVENDVSDDLVSLQNKTFYIDVWAGYECANGGTPYTRMPGLYKLFTGLCHGGTIEEVYGNRVMTCKIHDYMKVLRDVIFFNSPFFDGVKDTNAINELLTMAGFRAEGVLSDSAGFTPRNFPPNLLVRSMANNSLFTEQFFLQNVDGRVFVHQPYALPSEYNRLQQPAFKFDDGSQFYDAITLLAKKAAKLFYFDQHGIAHYEDFFDVIRQNISGLNDLPTVFDFTTNPNLFTGQLVLNKVDRTLDVEGIYNSIKMFSNDPNMNAIWVDQLNWNAFDDPETEGFIGYLKTMFQKEPVFGSHEATIKVSEFYKNAMFSPPVSYRFETYGLPVRSLDIVSIDGQSLRTTKVDHTLDPAKNLWWMTIEGERYRPLQ